MDKTQIEVTLKGIEGVSKAYSIVSSYSHRQRLAFEIGTLSHACRQLRT